MARLIDGLDITVAADALDDMELLEDLAELQDGKYGKLGAVLTRIVGGPDNKKRLYDHLRKDGKVHVTDAVTALQELLEAAGKKN